MGREDDDRLFEEAMRELGLAERGGRAGRDDAGGELAALMGTTDGPPEPPGGPRDRPRRGGRVSSERVEGSNAEARALAAEDRAFLEAMGALDDDLPAPPHPPAPMTDAARRATRGTRRALSRRIKVGTVVEERVLDLHGKTREAAFLILRGFLAAARADGVEVVKVITGRGLHSAGEAVLREALGPWLSRDLRDHVHEVVKAPPEHGGEGATFVFLRSPDP